MKTVKSFSTVNKFLCLQQTLDVLYNYCKFLTFMYISQNIYKFLAFNLVVIFNKNYEVTV